MSSMLNGFINFDSNSEIPIVVVNFDAINGKIDEELYKSTLVNVITTAIYVSKSQKYNVMFYATGIDEKKDFFANEFVSDLTKTFLAKEFTTPLNELRIYNSPSWLKKKVTLTCDTLYRSVRNKIYFLEHC